MKQCSGCQQNKHEDLFYRDKSKLDGLRYECKECTRGRMRDEYHTNPEKHRQRKQDERRKNPSRAREADKRYYQKNREKRIRTNTEYQRNRKKTDLSYRLACNLRSRLNGVVSGRNKAGSAVNDLGCSLDELKKHLENQFQNGMSWENYGDWHIDHIKPLASFDLTNVQEFRKACHYSNLRPLWAADNIKRNRKII